jgi:hypothetical protein
LTGRWLGGKADGATSNHAPERAGDREPAPGGPLGAARAAFVVADVHHGKRTATGVKRRSVVPSPSSPRELSPQHATPPDARSAQAW